MPIRIVNRILLGVLLQLLGFIAGIAQTAPAISVEIESGGSTMQGRFYQAECPTSCVTLLLVPGWPGGRQDVLGVGARLANSGINVLTFNPRGFHRSEGAMTFANSVDDVGAAFGWLHEEDKMGRFAIDTASIVVGGYSFGGGMAMVYAARDLRVKRVVSLAGTDHAELIRRSQRDSSFAGVLYRMLRADEAPGGPVNFYAEEALRELAENQHLFGLRETVPRLSDRSVLLLGGWEDENVTIEEHLLPVYRILKNAGGGNVMFLVYHDDHAFRRERERVIEDIRAWILDGTDRNE